MTASTRPAYTSPQCRTGQCGSCPGPCEIRIVGRTPTSRPVQTLRCDCDCHTRGTGG